MTATTIYWITRLDQFTSFLCVIWVASILINITIGVILVFFYVTTDNDELPEYESYFKLKKIFVKLLLFTFISGSISLALPSKEDLCLMYGVPKILNQNIQNDMTELYELYINKLKDDLKK